MTGLHQLGSRRVSRETLEGLRAYEAMLRRWNQKINLVSSSTLDDFWSRHALDSAQLMDYAPATARSWVDLGSGGGFPGLVVALLAAEERPELSMTLVESDRRKAAFLANAARELGLKDQLTVLAERAEDLPPLAADVVSARALAPLGRLLALAWRHLAPEGVALFPKGARWREEVDDALANWRFDLQNHPSKTDPAAAMLAIRGPKRA